MLSNRAENPARFETCLKRAAGIETGRASIDTVSPSPVRLLDDSGWRVTGTPPLGESPPQVGLHKAGHVVAVLSVTVHNGTSKVRGRGDGSKVFIPEHILPNQQANGPCDAHTKPQRQVGHSSDKNTTAGDKKCIQEEGVLVRLGSSVIPIMAQKTQCKNGEAPDSRNGKAVR